MLKASFAIGLAVCGVAVADSVAALADPVTDADIRGKKICWTTGITSAYNKDGSFDSNRSGHGTWTLSGGTLTVIASNGAGASQITKDDGTFHTLRTGRTGGESSISDRWNLPRSAPEKSYSRFIDPTLPDSRVSVMAGLVPATRAAACLGRRKSGAQRAF